MGLKSYDFEILDFLVRNNEVSIKELKKNMNLSISSIKVSMLRINKVLKKNFNFEILISENKIKLPSEKKELLKIKVLNSDKIIDICKKERIHYILLKLIFNQKINLSQISNEFLLNRLTILSDVKEIKSILKEFDLELESIPWKGVVLKGNHKNILDFSIKFLMYFYIKKIDNYNLALFYYTFVNSKSIEYIRNLIDYDLELKIKKCSKKVFNRFSLKADIHLYYTFVATLIYYKIRGKFEYEPQILEIENLADNAIRSLKILKNEKLIDCIQINDDKDFLVLIEIILNIDEKYLKSKKINSNISIFFNYIEKNLKINLNEEDKSYLIYTINKGALKKFFNYSEYKIPEAIDSYIFFYIKNKIEKKVIELFPLLSNEDIFNILVYIKNICWEFIDSSCKTKDKSICIIDSSFNSIHGDILKTHLEKYYYIKQINIYNFVEDLDYDFINDNFDAVFYLNIHCENENNIKIPWFEIPFMEVLFLNFEKYGLFKK